MEGSYNKNALILENKCSGKPGTFGNVQNEQFPSRYYLMYRCQCEVARACLRGIRSFAHSKTSVNSYLSIQSFINPVFSRHIAY